MKPVKTDMGLYAVDLEDSQGNTRHYEFEKWGAEKSQDVLIDLIKICGEAFGGVTGIVLRAQGDSGFMVADDAIAGLFGALANNLSKDKALTKQLMKTLSAEKVLVDGANIKYDTFYQDELALSFAAAYANIEVQYGNFFAAAGRLMGMRRAAVKGQSPSA